MLGECGGGCFEDDGGNNSSNFIIINTIHIILVTPMDFDEDDPAVFFCKTIAAPCQFPFIWNGDTHSACVQDEDFHWCALEVDPVSNVMVEDRWGKCDSCLAY